MSAADRQRRRKEGQQPSPGTLRWREWKARQDRGEIVLPVPCDHEMVEMMLDGGVIDERSSRDRRKLGEAIRRLAYERLANALDKTGTT